MSELPCYYVMAHRDGELVDVSGPYEAPSIIERITIREKLQKIHGWPPVVVTFELVRAS